MTHNELAPLTISICDITEENVAIARHRTTGELFVLQSIDNVLCAPEGHTHDEYDILFSPHT